MLGLSKGCFWGFVEESLVMLETIMAEVVGLCVGSRLGGRCLRRLAGFMRWLQVSRDRDSTFTSHLHGLDKAVNYPTNTSLSLQHIAQPITTIKNEYQYSATTVNSPVRASSRYRQSPTMVGCLRLPTLLSPTAWALTSSRRSP